MAENGTTLPPKPSTEETGFAENKGKGKAAENAPHHEGAAMDEDDEDDDDEDDDDDDDEEETGEPVEEDGMEEIDLNNIVEGGRRTRGAKIDFAKAAEKLPAEKLPAEEGEEDEEDEDDDFQPPAEDTEMSG
ncbi:hypothetical protein EsDP_00005995 [Epichloe bromicola]|uniref:Histone chaperone domain-containing protein n=1 Tax=Epichloe bromicola TaxID=79588 RepID=A0ABQ0CWB9_9HYPO